jgi:hypothetical protein
VFGERGIVLPTSPRCLKLREAMSGRLCSCSKVRGGNTDRTYGTHMTYRDAVGLAGLWVAR